MIQKLIPFEILGLVLVAIAPRVAEALAEAIEWSSIDNYTNFYCI